LLAPLRVGPCRTLFAAQAVSGLGDWAGRLALAALVYDRADSAAWAAAVTVVALLPWLGPGQLLATFADRFGRIAVMVTADLARAVLFGLMLLPQPTWLLLVWAFGAGLCVPPFAGSRSSTLVEVTPRDVYPAALALYGVQSQSEIMIGYALGGAVIAAFGPTTALAANAVTFVVSAVLLRSLRTTAAATRHERSAIGWAGVRAGVRVWRSDRVCLRALGLFVGVSMLMVLPEALVVPFTDQFDLAPGYVGAFAAIVAVGSIAGMLFLPTAATHSALLRIAAARAMVLAGIAGTLFAVGAHPVVAGAAYLVSGAVDAVAVPTNQVVGERLPTEGRAAAMSVAGGVQYGAQVLAITIAGAAATVWSAREVLCVAMFIAMAVGAWPMLRRPAAARELETALLRSI
jgi:MFS family permease